MTRLLPRISRRRAERDAAADAATGVTTAPAPPDQPPAAPPAPGDPASGSAPPAAASATQETVLAGRSPAGTEPAAPERPGFRERSRMRRRLQYLRRVRELGFRDLGGLVFDQHRFARPDEALVQAKLVALAAVDGELRAIERALDDERPISELREVGVSACARCGALIGSDARFCSSCGAAVHGARDVAPVVLAAPAVPAAAAQTAAANAPPAAGREPPPSPDPAGGERAAPPEPVSATPVAARLGAWTGGTAESGGTKTASQERPGSEARDAPKDDEGGAEPREGR